MTISNTHTKYALVLQGHDTWSSPKEVLSYLVNPGCPHLLNTDSTINYFTDI